MKRKDVGVPMHNDPTQHLNEEWEAVLDLANAAANDDICGLAKRRRQPLEAAFEVLTLAEACAMIKISKPTMFNLLARKSIPAKKVGRCWRFERISIINWLLGNSAWRASGGKR